MSWNKKHNLVATLSSDRACRTYNTKTKKIVSKSYKANLTLNDEASKKKKVGSTKETGASEGAKESEDKNSDNKGEVKSKAKGGKEAAGDRKASSKEKEKEVRLYHDETYKGFFRRLSWSNDGNILYL